MVKKEFESSLKLIVRSSFIVFLGMFLSKVLLYVFRIIIARNLGPEKYGIYSLAFIVFTFLLSVSSLGLSDGLVRFIPLLREEKRLKEITPLFRNILMISIVSGTLFGIILFFSSDFIAVNFFHEPALSVLLKIMGIAMPLYVISGVLINTFKAHEKIFLYSLHINIIQNLSKLLFMILFIFIGILSIEVIAFAEVFGTIVVLVSSYLFCRRALPYLFFFKDMKKDNERKILLEVFSYSWPIMFLSNILNLFNWIDTFFLGYYKGAISVGYFNAALPIIALFGFAPQIFMQLFLPLILKHYSRKDSENIVGLSKQLGKWIFMIHFPFFILLILFPGAIINVLFGKEYILAENALRILAIGGLYASFDYIFTSLLSMIGKSKLILYVVIVTSLVNLVLSNIFVPLYGVNGAAISTTLSQIVLSTLFFIVAYKVTKVFPFKRKMFIIVIASLIPTGILLIYRELISKNIINLIVGLVLYILIYLSLIIFLKGLDENDYLILNSIKNKVSQPFSK